MKYYVWHRTGTYLDAKSEQDAKEQLCELIRNNIKPSHCQADIQVCPQCGQDDAELRSDTGLCKQCEDTSNNSITGG
jgi:uncharacterized protein with PIN domain